ncbi:hypothetical protein H2200_007180 [Cladophialophora chaetospira]|uniref:Cystathionine gamma-synthase n=1 Tax=Cladophialophora chaetospira TaxID=386627 RepID=A0AA38X7C6_9EURO|nr:hypothetical protein H2200_007180 [Cladophialophora chaetospira]
MSVEIQTPFGTALPPAPRHAITVHAPAWKTMIRFKDRDPELFKEFKSMYPRFVLHKDVNEVSKFQARVHGADARLLTQDGQLTQRIITFANLDAEGQGCYIFPSIQAAADCVEFATSPARKEGTISRDKISVRIFMTHVPLHTVVFPVELTATVHGFWLNAGTGISSRLAEDSVEHADSLRELQPDEQLTTPTDSEAHSVIKERIAGLLNRAGTDSTRTVKVAPGDVYFFTTGMSAIYWVHRYLLKKYNSPSVLFGFSFHSTIHVLEDYGPGVEFFGLADESDLAKLEKHLSSQREQGKRVQAIWAEFPSNPLLNVPDLHRLRQLADEHDALLIIDETIGSFANIDVLSVADIIVTSLTKSFSGYADLMAGSAVLSPLSAHYSELKTLFESEHHNDFYVRDAEQLVHNSQDYLARSAILNNNAASIVSFLQSKALDPSSSVAQIFYPTTNPTHKNYTPFLRQPTPDFPSPGYGCLFSVEFNDMPSTIAFYDNLHIHKGPHLGAHLSLGLGYTLGIYGNELDWAGKFNLRPTQVRISVGLEDTQELLGVFKRAVKAADLEWKELRN